MPHVTFQVQLLILYLAKAVYGMLEHLIRSAVYTYIKLHMRNATVTPFKPEVIDVTTSYER